MAIALPLPAGAVSGFCQDVENLIDNLLATFPAVFESPAYQQKKTSIARSFNQRYNRVLDVVETKARSLNVALYRETDRVTFAPVLENKSLNEDQFTQLSQQQRDQFHKHTQALEEYLAETLLELPQWRREMVDEINQLDSATILQAINPLFKELNDRYHTISDVITYLAEIKKICAIL